MRRLLRRARQLLRPREHSLLFAFTGGSGAWPEMGRALYRREPVFRDAIDAAGVVVEGMLGWDPAARFRGVDEPEPSLEIERRNEIVQLGMVQLAQVDLWRAHGITPHGVVSVSLGEMVAPYAAGAISRDDCARLLATIAHAISKTPAAEHMYLLSIDAERVRRSVRLAPVPIAFLGSIARGASVVMAPDEHADGVRAFFGDAITREIPTDWNYHTPALRVDYAWLREQLRSVVTHTPFCPIFSAAAGGLLPPDMPFDAQFYSWMVSRPFLYAHAVEAALRLGYDTIVTLGPRPANNAWLATAARQQGREVRFIDSMRADEEVQAWSEAVGALKRARMAAPRAKTMAAGTLNLGDADAFAIYEELRAEGAVHWLPRHGYWLVIGYEEVRRALSDAELFSSDMPALAKIDPVLLANDGPGHATARRVASRYVTGEELARRLAFAERTAEELLQPLADGGELDVVTGLAHPLVTAVAADLVGVEAEEIARLNEAMIDSGGDLEKVYGTMSDAMAAGKRARMIGEFLADGLDEDSARSLTRLMWIAGTTPQHAIAPAVLLLLQHDDVRQRVQHDPSLLGAFVDESLRLQPPSLVIPRVVTADVEMGGHTIRAGARVHLGLAAANRDPAKFSDPATLRLDRGANPHLSFGGGMHHCLGASLGRGLLAAALRALFRVAPHFHAVQPLATVRRASGTTLQEIEGLVIGA